MPLSTSETSALARLDASGPAFRRRLERWCSINSGSDHAAGLGRMLATLREDFAAAFPHARCSTPALGDTGLHALLVSCRTAAPRRILLNGHYDTVYGATHPFQQVSPTPDPDVLRGPGVIDMKGGIAVLLAALETFEASPAAASGTLGWDVLLAPDEETGSTAIAPLYASIARDFLLGLVFEPAASRGNLVRRRMGTGTLTATCHGRAAHAGRARAEGRNAIVALSRFLIAADGLPDAIPGTLLNVGRIEGGGAVNIVPDLAVAELNLRTSSAGDETAARAFLQSAADAVNATEGFRLEVQGRLNRPPLEVSADRESAFLLWKASAADLGIDLDWVDVGGGSDANLLAAAGLPCLDGLGPVGGDLHSDREWVRLSSLPERARVASLVLLRLASGS